MGGPSKNTERVSLVDSDGNPVNASFYSVVNIARPNNATPYAAGDVVGNSAAAGGAVLEFKNVGMPGGDTILTKTAIMIALAAIPAGMVGFTLHLYSESPPSALGDNAAWALPSGDNPMYLGPVVLGAPLVVAGVAATLYLKTIGLVEEFRVGATGSLFGYLVTDAGYTPAANTAASVALNSIVP